MSSKFSTPERHVLLKMPRSGVLSFVAKDVPNYELERWCPQVELELYEICIYISR